MADPDRLTPLDASFLQLEDDGRAHMHVAGLLIFAGRPPAYDDLVAGMEAKLHLVPRYRQRLAFVPGGQARPMWVDDEHFNAHYHVRSTGLPAPRGEAELRALAGRVFSQRLDREKPLWESWLVEELEGDRFAVLSKTHHCLVDGVSGVDITAVMFDLDPDAPPPGPPEPWRPRPAPSGTRLLAGGLRDVVQEAAGAVTAVPRLVASPGRITSGAASAAAGVGQLVTAATDPAPKTPYNVPIGPHRRYAFLRASLAEVKAIKGALGGTVNDVVLAAVTGMVRRHLERRGVEVPDRLRPMIPVSVRSDEERGALGNRVVSLHPDLSMEPDPVSRLKAISVTLEQTKRSNQAVGAQFLVNVGSFLSPTLMAAGARSFASRRAFNVTVTNVPGPQFPLYLRGSRLLDFFPMVPLAQDHALGIAVMSYNGRLGFGLLADFDAVPDLDDLPADLDAALAELAAAAGVPHEPPPALPPVEAAAGHQSG